MNLDQLDTIFGCNTTILKEITNDKSPRIRGRHIKQSQSKSKVPVYSKIPSRYEEIRKENLSRINQMKERKRSQAEISFIGYEYPKTLREKITNEVSMQNERSNTGKPQGADTVESQPRMFGNMLKSDNRPVRNSNQQSLPNLKLQFGAEVEYDSECSEDEIRQDNKFYSFGISDSSKDNDSIQLSDQIPVSGLDLLSIRSRLHEGYSSPSVELFTPDNPNPRAFLEVLSSEYPSMEGSNLRAESGFSGLSPLTAISRCCFPSTPVAPSSLSSLKYQATVKLLEKYLENGREILRIRAQTAKRKRNAIQIMVRLKCNEDDDHH